MNKIINKYISLNQITFYVFLLLTALVPLSFWGQFENKFDLIKTSVIYIIGGFFIIFSCLNYINNIKNNDFFGKFRTVKTLDILIIIFLFSVVISTIFSKNAYISFYGTYERQIGLLLFLYLVIIYFFSTSFLYNENRLEKLLIVMEIIALITSLYSITGYIGFNIFNLTPENSIRSFTNIGHPVFTAGFITFLFPVSLLNITNKKNKIIRIIFPLVMFVGIILTLTRTAYIALTIEILIILIFLPVIYKFSGSKLKNYYFFSAFSILFFIIFIIALTYKYPDNEFIKRIISFSSLMNQPRWYLWKDSIKMFIQNPLTGTGPGMFSNVFENFSSYQLRFADIHGAYDNAHNNFLNFFSTLGITGGLSYLLILFNLISTSAKNIFIKNTDSKANFFYLFILSSFSGYFVYGLADFDDISILLYLFVLLSIFKSKYLIDDNQSIPIKKLQNAGKIGYVFFILLIIFSITNIYFSILRISAEDNYSYGIKNYNLGKFYESINYFDKAIHIQPVQSQYRYSLGLYLLMYCSDNKELSVDMKEKWLKIAKEEINKSIINYPYRSNCLSILTFIELELGNEKEADKIKSEIFETDTCKFAFRVKLADYYFKHNKVNEAIKEINFVLNYDINNMNALSAKLKYLNQSNKSEETADICKKILEINSNNKFTKSIFSWLESKPNEQFFNN